MSDQDVLRHYVREDAWEAVQAMYPATDILTAEEVFAAAVATALTVEGNLKGVAAYLLETLCAKLQADDAASPDSGQVTKSYEVVGEWKEEFFAGQSAELKLAGVYCARAADLRSSRRARVTANPAPNLEGWEIRP